MYFKINYLQVNNEAWRGSLASISKVKATREDLIVLMAFVPAKSTTVGDPVFPHESPAPPNYVNDGFLILPPITPLIKGWAIT
ncbi:hypothetical protein [Neobacillus mesonae]|uniref:hypothetical protein n=1 Tax=Neobacillus mesonae TaxID=1193713 RepID=UPI0020422BED|nr:hypothetical protein [Neobacillus mesonae]MCM3569350.1 hypothetical protein [Neobacillus mesonae]